ncbi:MAG TPA: response regulator [Kiritimatiellia bacterium]
MNLKTVNLLLIEDDVGIAGLIRNMLRGVRTVAYDVHHVISLREGLAGLKSRKPDIIVTDLGLPDSAGLATVVRVIVAAPDVPVIVLTAQADGDLAVSALRRGSQDYLVKSRIDAIGLDSSIRFALERHETSRTAAQVERDRVVEETAGSFAHHINQPLTVLTLLAEHMLRSADPKSSDYDLVQNLHNASTRIEGIVKEFLNAKYYATSPYSNERRILDLAAAGNARATVDGAAPPCSP